MNEKILIIDDAIFDLKMAKHILKNHFEVICTASGKEGLDILRSNSIDLVLLDIYMTQMNGLEVLKAIREDPAISSVKVIVLTASGIRTDVTESVRLGALDFIKKPFFVGDFLDRIKNVLQIDKKENILVVDDDSLFLRFTQKALGIRYDVSCVNSGQEAIAYMQNHIPDLILLDLHMPDMNGLEVMKKMQYLNHVSDIPVIFLTADDDRETEAELFKAGAMDYIRKPFSNEVLIRRINRILELYRYQKSLQSEVDKKTKELIEKNRKVVNLSTQVMQAFAGVIDAKDRYTNGHSLRVAKYSSELARRMGKEMQEIMDIYYIALLHDIGKIGIPDGIINKKGRLTDEEYESMKKHPVIGAQILENISEIPDISVGAHWHHERYDGGGYPDGLAGEEIPQVARIIGVADAYDAMTSNRSYRDLLPQSAVRSEIEKGKGTQFDPEIADLMLEMMEEDTEYQLHE